MSDDPVPPSRKSSVPAALKWLGLLTLGYVILKVILEPAGEMLKSSAPTLATKFADETVREAAQLSGTINSSDFMVMLILVGVFWMALAMSNVLTDSVVQLRRGAKHLRTHTLIGFVILAGLVFLVVAGLAMVQLRANAVSVYRAFHTNLEEALPVLSLQEERELRSQFARARTVKDLTAVDARFAELSKKLDAAYPPPKAADQSPPTK